MIGVAGFAAASSTAAFAESAAPPPEPVKWQPYWEVGAGGDDQSGLGSVNLFVPLQQKSDSLLFARLGVQTRLKSDNIESVDLGYRFKNTSGFILGGYVGIDHRDTDFGNDFTQVSGGLEVMNEIWDAHINAYSANRDPKAVAGRFRLDIHDTFIGMSQLQEAAFSGFDGEVGFRVFHGDATDVRLYAGGYDFSVHDSVAFPTKALRGPKGGVEVDLYDLDFIGPQSRFQVTGEIRNDDLRGTTGFVGAQLRIPLGDQSGAAAQALDELDRRMVDNFRRQDGIATSAQYNKSEPVIIYGHGITSQPTNTLLYVDNTAGAGTLADPTTLPDATTRPGPNQFIVLTDNDGGTVHTGGATLAPGETMVGGGKTFDVRGANSGFVIPHTFAPGTGPITIDNAGGALILSPDTSISGITVSVTSGDAIYGHNVHDVTISDVTIDGNGTAANGIVLKQDAPGDGTVTITDTTITGFTGDGVQATVTGTGGATNFDLEVSDSTINVGGNGVLVDGTATGGAVLDIHAGVHNSTVTGGITPVSVTGTATPGASITQTLTVDPTYLTGGNYGFVLHGNANGGSVTQNVTLADLVISGTSKGGVTILGDSSNGGHLTQNVSIDRVEVTGSNVPFGFAATAETGGTTTQTVAIDHITSDAALGFGIGISGTADGGRVSQTVDADHLVVTDALYAGIAISGTADDDVTANDGLLAQYVSLAHAFVTDSGIDGAGGVHGYGIRADLSAQYGGVARQDIGLASSALNGNGATAYFDVAALGLGSAQQNIAIVDTKLRGGAVGSALTLIAAARTGGFAEQNTSLYHSDLSHAADSALSLTSYAAYGGNTDQNLTAYYDNFSHSGSDNISVKVSAVGYQYPTNAAGYAYYSHAGQLLLIGDSNISRSGGTDSSGVLITTYSGAFAEVNQYAYFYNDDISHNLKDGIGVTEIDTEGSSLYTSIGVYDSNLSRNGGTGLSVVSQATGGPYGYGGYLIGYVTVSGSDLSHNGIAGIANVTTAAGIYSFNQQTITLADSHFDHNQAGAVFYAAQSYGYASFGAAIQNVTITDSTFNRNATNGMAAYAIASDVQGRAEQHFVALYSEFDNNGVSGLSLIRSASGGDLRNNLYCTDVQGLTGGCAFVRQTFLSYGLDVSHNKGNGITLATQADTYGAIYNASGRPLEPTFYIGGSNISDNKGDGIQIANSVTNNSYQYEYIDVVNSHVDNNTGYGISSGSLVDGGSALLQYVVVAGDPGKSSVSGNGKGGLAVADAVGAGVIVSTVATVDTDFKNNGGNGVAIGSIVGEDGVLLQQVAIFGGSLSDNGNMGLAVAASIYGGYAAQIVGASDATFDGNAVSGIVLGGKATIGATHAGQVAQYATILDSTITNNVGYGGIVAALNVDSGSTGLQTLAVSGTKISGNALGVSAVVQGSTFGSAEQDVVLIDDRITDNTGNGVSLGANGQYDGFAVQNIYIAADKGKSVISRNGGDGVAIGGYATLGGNTEQNTGIYDTQMNRNGGSGLHLVAYAYGYVYGPAAIYYSHVTQNTIAYYDAFNHNKVDGVQQELTAKYLGQVDSYLVVGASSASSNKVNGISLLTHADAYSAATGKAYQTDVTTNSYFIGVTAGGNRHGSGIYVSSYDNGPSYLIQHVLVQDSHLDGNYFAGFGDQAHGSNVYTANLQYVTLVNSTFNDNHIDGIALFAEDTFGPYSFGLSLQQVTISGSQANGNGNGLSAYADASGNQGRAEQYISVQNSTFNNNKNDGITLTNYAHDGVLVGTQTCDTVQGATGGCAIVRQRVSLNNVTVRYNGSDGIYVNTVAKNLGSVYAQGGRPSPQPATLVIANSNISDNGGDGVYLTNDVEGASYVFQRVYAVNSVLDNNGGDAVGSVSYVSGGSILAQTIILYNYKAAFTANGNDGAVVSVATHAADAGSYASSNLVVIGIDGSNNGDGISITSVSDNSGAISNSSLALYSNTLDGLATAVSLIADGSGVKQTASIAYNLLTNAVTGVLGNAVNGATQEIDLHYGNDTTGTTTPYSFTHDGTSTQTITY